MSLPVVSVWTKGASQWEQVGQVGDYSALTFAPAHLDVGGWEMTLPYAESALLLTTDRLVTVDWRGARSTWVVSDFVPHADDETGQPTLTVAGVGALSMLGWITAWPDPSLAIGSQPVVLDTDPAPHNAPAETVITDLVAGNLRDRYGADITVPASQGRGANVKARPVMDNLLELVRTLAKDGGLTVDVGLVNTTSTRADLTLQIGVPVDRSASVLLTSAAGTLDRWEQHDTEPTATKALVGGAGNGGVDRVFEVVTTPESEAAATAWGGHREIFVDGPDTFDPAELQQAGRDALTSGAATRTLALVSSEAEGMQAFTHYNVGDLATAEVLTGASVVDVITSIEVSVTDDGLDVAPVFGNPSATDAQLDIAEQVGALRKALRRQERK